VYSVTRLLGIMFKKILHWLNKKTHIHNWDFNNGIAISFHMRKVKCKQEWCDETIEQGIPGEAEFY